MGVVGDSRRIVSPAGMVVGGAPPGRLSRGFVGVAGGVLGVTDVVSRAGSSPGRRNGKSESREGSIFGSFARTESRMTLSYSSSSGLRMRISLRLRSSSALASASARASASC